MSASLVGSEMCIRDSRFPQSREEVNQEVLPDSLHDEERVHRVPMCLVWRPRSLSHCPYFWRSMERSNRQEGGS
eukprot:1039380-Alexandrium_andersonii.AAC.1